MDVNIKDSSLGFTTLYWACFNKLPDVTLEILKRDDGADVNAIFAGGRTTLQMACYNNLPDVALEILKRDNVDVYAKNKFGETALDIARRQGCLDIARHLDEYAERQKYR